MINAQIGLILTVTETLSLPFADLSSSNKQVKHDGLNVSVALNATSTSPVNGELVQAVSQVAEIQLAMTSGSATIDLESLAGTQGMISGAGQKVAAMLLNNPSTNANQITVEGAVSNGYNFGGTLTLQPGESVLWYKPGTSPTIGSGAHLITVSGTGAQVINGIIVLG